MSDPTPLVLTVSFVAALGIFGLGTAARFFLRSGQPVEAVELEVPDLVDSPYVSPVSEEAPLPLQAGKIQTGFYNRIDLLGIALIYLIFFGLVMGSVHASTKTELVLDPTAILTSIGFQFILAGIAILMVYRRIHPIDWLGLKWPQWPWIFIIAPSTVFAMWMVFGALQLGGYMKWIESLGVESVQDTVKLLQTSNDPLLLGLMAFAAVIAAPLCEEIVFRGYLYPAAKNFAGPRVAGVFTALVFASAHASLGALLPLFIFGLALAFVYEKTGSLLAPIAIHLCFNGATVAIQLAARAFNLPLDPSL